MITAEMIKEKEKKQAAATGQDNEEILKSGVVRKKRNYLPWIIGGVILLGGSIWLYKNLKKGGNKSAISS